MRIKRQFCLRLWRLTLHNKEQWDLGRWPLVCAHWSYDHGNGSVRIFCI